MLSQIQQRKNIQKALESKYEKLDLYTKSLGRDKLKLAADNDDLNTKNNALRLKIGKLGADIVQLQAHHKKQQQDLSELTAQNELLLQKIKATEISQNQFQNESHIFIQENEKLQYEINQSKNQLLNKLEQERDLLNSLKAMSSRYATLEEKWNQLTKKQAKFVSTKLKLQKENERLQQVINILQNKIEESNKQHREQKEALEKQNEKLLLEKRELEKNLSNLEFKLAKHANSSNKNSKLEDKYDLLIEENIQQKNELADIVYTLNSYKTKNLELNQLLKELKEENSILNLQLISNQENHSEELTMEAQTALKKALGKRIKIASEREKDDLKKIKGLGLFIEKKLNKFGIFTYEQISQLDDELINTVSKAIKFFPDKIIKDDWVGQASDLLKIKLSDLSEFKKKKEKRNPKDQQKKRKKSDLKILEGIDYKVEKLLNNSGIKTFIGLSKITVGTLQNILENGGRSFEMRDPQSWPEQARLAANDEWEKLIEFQSKLMDGKK